MSVVKDRIIVDVDSFLNRTRGSFVDRDTSSVFITSRGVGERFDYRRFNVETSMKKNHENLVLQLQRIAYNNTLPFAKFLNTVENLTGINFECRTCLYLTFDRLERINLAVYRIANLANEVN